MLAKLKKKLCRCCCWCRPYQILCPQRFGKGKNKGENIGEEKMTYQIEAIIEKFSQDSVELKGTGEYLFEKKKDEKYCNILEVKSNGSSIELKSIKDDEQIDFAEFKDLLIPAFIEKKSLKFTLKDEAGKYTITAVSHAST